MHRGDALFADERGKVRGVAVPVGPGEHHGGALAQRPEELPDADVEAGRRLLQHPVVGTQPVLALHPRQPVDDGPMGHDHALRTPGRPRRVDQVRRVIRRRTHRGVRVERGRRGIEEEAGEVFHLRESRGGGGGRHHRARARVGEHVSDAVRRIVDVDRQVGRARLQHAEQCHHQLRRTRHGDRDDALRARAPGSQAAGEELGAGVQLLVGEGLTVVHDGRGLRGTRHLGLEGGGQSRLGDLPFRAGEPGSHRLLVREQVDAGGVLPGVVGQSAQDAGEPLRDPPYGRAGKALGMVLQPQVEPAARLDDQGERVVDGVVELVTGDPHRP